MGDDDDDDDVFCLTGSIFKLGILLLSQYRISISYKDKQK